MNRSSSISSLQRNGRWSETKDLCFQVRRKQTRVPAKIFRDRVDRIKRYCCTTMSEFVRCCRLDHAVCRRWCQSKQWSCTRRFLNGQSAQLVSRVCWKIYETSLSKERSSSTRGCLTTTHIVQHGRKNEESGREESTSKTFSSMINRLDVAIEQSRRRRRRWNVFALSTDIHGKSKAMVMDVRASIYWPSARSRRRARSFVHFFFIHLHSSNLLILPSLAWVVVVVRSFSVVILHRREVMQRI